MTVFQNAFMYHLRNMIKLGSSYILINQNILGTVVGSYKYGDEPLGPGTTELVGLKYFVSMRCICMNPVLSKALL
jgi:delta 1-pyrroline-5-carboxylate dehydrogenase